jgi:hypothetical protein
MKSGSRIARHIVRNPLDARWIISWLRLRSKSPIDAGVPWLPFRITALLAKEIKSNSTVFEYGGGGSTKWFLKTSARQVITVEHDKEWLKVLNSTLPSTTRHRMLPVDIADSDGRAYIESIRQCADESIDIVVVDGRRRVDCAQEAAPKIRKGGLLVLDDIDRDRYKEVYEILADWPTIRIDGLCPGKQELGHSAVFRKP